MKNIFRLGIKSEYCKDYELIESSNVFWNLSYDLDGEQLIQEQMHHWLWRRKYILLSPIKKWQGNIILHTSL